MFEALADKMRELPDLEVTMCLDINRDRQDKTPSEIMLSRFVQRFKDHQWPSATRLCRLKNTAKGIVGFANQFLSSLDFSRTL